MSKSRKLYNTLSKSLPYLGLFGTTSLAAVNLAHRSRDSIQGQDSFSQHSRLQQQKHFFSGMHEPLMPSPEQLSLFQKHFSQYAHLLPTALDAFRDQQALKTPVKIKPLSDCPVSLDFKDADTLVVGGVPALMSAISILKQGKKLKYVNDGRRRPISFGSALHLEYDGESEAPTSYQPSQFLFNQIMRAGIGYVSHSSIEQTGLYPWRTLDWIGWLRQPAQWAVGIRVALAFQLATMANVQQRQALQEQVAIQCKKNEKFYDELNNAVGGKLLLPGKGSIIVARNDEEVSELDAMKISLTKEKRTLNYLSEKEMIQRYGLAFNGSRFAEKTHDRVLSPNFMEILTQHIQKQGGEIIDGTLTTVYSDHQQVGGIAEYRTPDGQRKLVPFSQLIMSLGSQPILDSNDKPLFDVVAARGVSVLAHLTVPSGCKVPSVMTCGGTNHVTKLSVKPVSIQDANGKSADLYLMRMTAGACITPNISEKDAADYDGSIALGLVTSVRKTFGDQCTVEPVTVYGCNRQVSKFGQIRWIKPYPSIDVQYAAGGGGLTRGPDFAVTQVDEQPTPTPQMGRSN